MMPKVVLPGFLVSKRVAIALGGLLALLAAAFMLLPSLVDVAQLRAGVERQFQERTGQALLIKGEVKVSMFPKPYLTLSKVEVQPAPSEQPLPSLRAEQVQIGLGMGSLWSGAPQISSVALVQPVLDITRAADGYVYGGWLKLLSEKADLDQTLAIFVKGGSIFYRTGDEPPENIRDVHMKMQLGAAGTLPFEGSMSARGKVIAVSGDLGGLAYEHAPVKLEVNDGSALRWVVDAQSQGVGVVGGTSSLMVQDVRGWSASPMGEAAVPLSMESRFAWDHRTLTLSEAKIDGGLMKGTLSGNVAVDLVSKAQVQAALETVNADALAALLVPVAPRQEPTSSVVPEVMRVFPRWLQVNAKVESAAVQWRAQRWEKMVLDAAMEDHLLTLQKLSLGISDEDAMTVFGIVSETPQGLRFEGNLESEGKDLRRMLGLVDGSLAHLPSIVQVPFTARANLFVAADQLRISEADVKAGTLTLFGGLVAYREQPSRIEADIRLSNINLDGFRDGWREELRQRAVDRWLFTQADAAAARWLKELSSNVTFNLVLDKFHFLGRDGDTASLKLEARPGELALYNLKMIFPDDSVDGNFTLDVRGEEPSFMLSLNATSLNTDYFLPEDLAYGPPMPPQEMGQARWSQELWDFSWLSGYRGDLDININRLMHGYDMYRQFKMKALVDNEQMRIERLAFERWGGALEATGTLGGGKVPSLSMSVSLKGAELSNLIRIFSPMDRLSGPMSLSAVIVTSGINQLSWVQQMDAKLALVGRGVRARGFNLGGVTSAVQVARSVADVVNNVGRVVHDGHTYFSVDGNVNVKDGFVRTPGITLQSEGIKGTLIGEVNLLQWMLKMNARFQFPMLESQMIPTLSVDISGPVDNPENKVDTSSLEAYVAKRIVGQ